ncbi:MAG: ECF transporter S component [Ruminococcaceae bacterium]|nr:ECF transporter S component [Oscillospiraceae bacterium]
MKTTNTQKITTLAVLTALSIVLVATIHIPMPAPISFLEYDPADIPILIAGFAYGPISGILVTIVASVLQGATVSAQSGLYGIIMHVIATGTLVTVSSLIYSKKKTKKRAAISVIAGTFSMAVAMFFANLVITPCFMMGAINKVTVGAVLDLMPFIILFNLGKAGLNGLITFLIYKRISNLIKKN